MCKLYLKNKITKKIKQIDDKIEFLELVFTNDSSMRHINATSMIHKSRNTLMQSSDFFFFSLALSTWNYKDKKKYNIQSM